MKMNIFILLLFWLIPSLCGGQAIAHYLHNISFNLQITTIQSPDLDSCWQFVSDSNMISSINNIYQWQLASYTLFNIVSPPETNVIRCSQNEESQETIVLLATNITVVSNENRTDAVATFYTNSILQIQMLYPQYSLAYTYQNIKIDLHQQFPSSTITINASNFYTTDETISSLFTSTLIQDGHAYYTKAWEVWKLQWWDPEGWHGWKIFGIAAFVSCCVMGCVICYKCCCCKCKHSNKYKSHKTIPTEDTDEEIDSKDEQMSDKDGLKLHTNKLYDKVLSDPEINIQSVTSPNIVEDVLPSRSKPNNHEPLTPMDDVQSDSDIENLYEKPNKSSATSNGPTTSIPYLSNGNQRNTNNANNANICEFNENSSTQLAETGSNRTRIDSMSIPQIPPSPRDGFEGSVQAPCLLNQNQAGLSHKYDIKSRASNDSAGVDANFEEENKYNELMYPQNGARFNNCKYRPMVSHSRCNSQSSVAVSCTGIQSNRMFKRQKYDELGININDDKHREVMDWLVKDVRLRDEHTIKYFNVFAQNGFDTIELVANIRYDDLEAIGINKRGHVQTLLRAIGKLKLAPPKECSSNSSVTHEYPSQISGIYKANFNNQSSFSQNS